MKQNAENSLIYCDPPYNNTTKYKFGDFDSDTFWQWCRDISKKKYCNCCRYNAPNDFEMYLGKRNKDKI